MKDKRQFIFTLGLVIFMGLIVAEPSFASFESSLITMKTKLSNVVLPVLATMGLLFAGFSFISGNPNARQHIIYAVVGCILGFGAQGIVDFISSSIR